MSALAGVYNSHKAEPPIKNVTPVDPCTQAAWLGSLYFLLIQQQVAEIAA